MVSYDSYDQDMLLSRSRRKLEEADPIEQQRSALFGDSVKPYLGTMEELSRTKRRQEQRARELLFASKPELSYQGRFVGTENNEDANINKAWVGFDHWGGFEEADWTEAGAPPDINCATDQPLTIDEVEEFLRDHRKSQLSRLEVEPVKAEDDSARRFELLLIEPDPVALSSMISHGLPLEEELGRFVLKLEKLQADLKPQPEFSAPSGEPLPFDKEPEAPVDDAVLMPDGAPYYKETRAIPDTIAPAEAFTPTPRHAEPYLPKGNTPEETFNEAMAIVESKAINVKERKSWAFRIIAALIVLGALALLTLGVLQAVRLSENPAGILKEPEFMDERQP